MAGAASQAGDADSSRAPGLTSALQGSVNVHRGALLLVPQCASVLLYFTLKTTISMFLMYQAMVIVFFHCLSLAFHGDFSNSGLYRKGLQSLYMHL